MSSLLTRLALLLLVLAPEPAQEPTITVTPSEGSLTDTFVVAGCGFGPGRAVDDSYVSPEGIIQEVYLDASPTLLVADAGGCVSDAVIPARDFVDAQPGTWSFWFCADDPPGCSVADLNLTP